MTKFFDKHFSQDQKKKFQDLILEAWAENDLSFNAVESFSFKRLLTFLNPACANAIPSRRKFANKLLPEESSRELVTQKAAMLSEQKATSSCVTLILDTWENVARNHILGVMLLLQGRTLVWGSLGVGLRNDGLALAALVERLIIDVMAAGFDIGCLVTDDAGNFARARRILAFRWPKIIFQFCLAHQVNLIVKDVLKNNEFQNIAVAAAKVINVFNASTSKWLPRLKARCIYVYGKSWSLLRLMEVRWNSAQAAFASLLRIRTAVKSFVIMNQYRSDFPHTLKCAGTDIFWEKVEYAESIIRPMSYASFIFQRTNASMAHAVYIFFRIYLSFRANSASDLIEIIERRWLAMEQPLFMLAIHLDPRFQPVVDALQPQTSLTGPAQIVEVAVIYYQQLIGLISAYSEVSPTIG